MQRPTSDDATPKVGVPWMCDLLDAYLAAVDALPPRDRLDIKRAFEVLAKYEWPEVLRLSDAVLQRATKTTPSPLWTLVRDMCLAMGYPSQLDDTAWVFLDREGNHEVEGLDSERCLERFRRIIVGGVVALSTFNDKSWDVFRHLRAGIATVCAHSDGKCTFASFIGLREFAHSTKGPKCPYVMLTVPWRRAIERLERAYLTCCQAGAAPPKGFTEFRFHRIFKFMVGEEAYNTLLEIKGMNRVKEQLQALVKEVYIDIQKDLPFNGYGHFVFVGNPGLGKSLVAKALLEILRGIGLRHRALSSLDGDQFKLDDLSGQIQELEQELERTGGEGTQGRRAFVDRLRKQQDELGASLRERKANLLAQNNEKRRSDRLKRGRPAKSGHEETFKATVHFGCMISRFQEEETAPKKRLGRVMEFDPNDNTVKVLLPNGTITSWIPSSTLHAEESSDVKAVRVCRNWAAAGTCSFGARCTFSHVDRDDGVKAVPKGPIQHADAEPMTLIRSIYSGNDRGFQMEKGQLGVVVERVAGREGVVLVMLFQHEGRTLTLDAEHFERISEAELQAEHADFPELVVINHKLTCDNDHPTEVSSAHGFRCDRCQSTFRQIGLQCRRCHFDMCQRCAKEAWKSSGGIRQPPKKIVQRPQGSKIQRGTLVALPAHLVEQAQGGHAMPPSGGPFQVFEIDHNDNTFKVMLPGGNTSQWLRFADAVVMDVPAATTKGADIEKVGTFVRCTFTGNDQGASLKAGMIGVVMQGGGGRIMVTVTEDGIRTNTYQGLSSAHFEIISESDFRTAIQNSPVKDGTATADASEPLKFKSTTGSELLLDGPKAVKEMIDGMVKGAGGVIFIDEVYQLDPQNDRTGAHILNLVMEAMETHRKKLTIIVAGYEDNVDKVMAYNPGMRSRFGWEIKFPDYKEGELHELYTMFVRSLTNNKCRVAKGHEQAVAIIARRLARGANQKQFGNARLVRTRVSEALRRAKARLFDATDEPPCELLWNDILGMCPFSELKNNYAPIERLQRMIGFPLMKRRMLEVAILIIDQQVCELEGCVIEDIKMNQRFYGNQGTGKTNIAKIYAAILADLGITSKNDVYITTPTALKGSAVGEAEKAVSAMMENAREKVLFIDEAYLLHDDTPYSKAMTDSLVSEIADVPGFRPIIVIAGYKDRMEEMLINANPGLYRRLAPNLPFEFEDFTEAELSLMVSALIVAKARSTSVSSRAVVEHAVKLLLLQKQRPNFGNGGAVDTLVSLAVQTMQSQHRIQLEKSDFGILPSEAELVADVDTSNVLRTWFDKTLNQIERGRARGVTIQVPTTWLISGAQGTGKRRHAKHLLTMMNSLNVLNSHSFKEVTCSSLVGPAVGTSVPKLMALLKEQLGGVLFIHRGDRLRDSGYGEEVFRQLVDVLGKAEFAGRICVVMSSSPEGVSSLMSVDPSATSRFKFLELPSPSDEDIAEACWERIQSLTLNIARTPEMHAVFASAAEGIRASHRGGASFGNYRVAAELVNACDLFFEDLPWTTAGVHDVAVTCHRAQWKAPSEGRDITQQRAMMATATAVTSSLSVKTMQKTALKEKESEEIIPLEKTTRSTVFKLEALAAALEEGVAEGVFSKEVAQDVAQNLSVAQIPREVARFLESKGLTPDLMKSQLTSMRQRLEEAKVQGLVVCPICFLPEESARGIGCPWSF